MRVVRRVVFVTVKKKRRGGVREIEAVGFIGGEMVRQVAKQGERAVVSQLPVVHGACHSHAPITAQPTRDCSVPPPNNERINCILVNTNDNMFGGGGGKRTLPGPGGGQEG
jgi:hypothetical protein